MIHTDGTPTIASGTRRDFAKQARERQDKLAKDFGPLLKSAAKREGEKN